MHSSIGFGLLLTTLCILDVSHGAKPTFLDRLLRRKLSTIEPVPIPIPVLKSQELSQTIVDTVRDDVFRKSNSYRSDHSLQEFKISQEIQEHAQKAAIIHARGEEFPSNPDGLYFYKITPFNHVGEVLVDTWYMTLPFFCPMDTEEEKAENRYAATVTRLLWKNSNEIGIGVAKDIKENLYHIVVGFYPPGNIVGEYKYNQPIFDREQAIKEYAKHILITKMMGAGKNLLSQFGDGKTCPNLPGWSSTLYDTPKVPIGDVDKTAKSYIELFGESKEKV